MTLRRWTDDELERWRRKVALLAVEESADLPRDDTRPVLGERHHVVRFDELTPDLATAGREVEGADLTGVAVDALRVLGGSDPTALC
jgi:hypothetical protein